VAPPNTTISAREIHSMVSTLRCLTHTQAICMKVAAMATTVARNTPGLAPLSRVNAQGGQPGGGAFRVLFAHLIGGEEQDDGEQIEEDFHRRAVGNGLVGEGRRAFCYDSTPSLNLSP
jgi:hypothetical protein